ncbi:flippase [Pseudidiomarina sediminum]|uniref:Flippase n=1 Tax=Pseudidiomarina sediminum TaxID=431675 RepID=A0A432Z9C0_9GAMM|nr:flippase [Pseudidiomarina sediminum]RUO74527.1 flippase [Pseudidiomarina sediminum]
MKWHLGLLGEKLKESNEGRVVARNLGFLTLLQIGTYIFPLFTIPYLARTIGVDGFGKIAFAAAVMVWFRTITDWGFNYTATRDVARNRENREKVSEIFSHVIWAQLLLMLVAFLMLLAAIYLIPYFYQNRVVLLASFLMLPGYILFPIWLFQAMEKMKYITILDLISKTLFTTLLFIFITNEDDYVLQPLFIASGYALSAVVAMYIILVNWRIKLYFPTFNSLTFAIRKSANVFVNNIMPNLYNSLSVVILAFVGGSHANGILDAGTKFINIAQGFLNVISKAFFPFLSRRIDKHAVYTYINLVLSVFVAGFLFISSPVIVKFFYGDEFMNAVPVLQIMSISVVSLSLNNVYGINYLIIRGYEKELRNITVTSSLIGLTIAYPMIYYYGYLGAAFVITFTRFILGVSIFIKAKALK